MYTHSTFMYMLGNILGRPLAPRNVDGRPDHVEEFHDDLLVVLPFPTYLCLNDLRNHTRTIYRDTIYTLLTLEGQKPISGQIGSALSNGFGLIAQTVARASAALFCGRIIGLVHPPDLWRSFIHVRSPHEYHQL